MQQSPKVYATFLLWLLSELFERLPEIGDPEKPKLVFFFDEAHLLFADIAPAVEQKIEQMVRLIRSKGVGVYFVSQNPLDIPDVVLGQLGNRVQHALRAFTPRDQKAVKAAAQTFRQNPKLKVENVLTQLAVGEALVSMLDENGARKSSSARRSFRRAARSARSRRISGQRSSASRSSPVIMKRLSIANRPTKNSRREQGRKRKQPAHRLWLPAPQRPRERSLRYWLKLSAPPRPHSNPQSDSVAAATIHCNFYRKKCNARCRQLNRPANRSRNPRRNSRRQRATQIVVVAFVSNAEISGARRGERL